jgi:hypothetical protein
MTLYMRYNLGPLPRFVKPFSGLTDPPSEAFACQDGNGFKVCLAAVPKGCESLEDVSEAEMGYAIVFTEADEL